MLLQPDKSNLILTMIKEVESYEAMSNWKLMKKSEVNNKHKKNMAISRLFYQFFLSSEGDSQMEEKLNTNPYYLYMEDFNNGDSTTGKLMIQ